MDDDYANAQQAGGTGPEKMTKPKGEELARISLCLYPGGRYALTVDDGEKIDVGDLDTALAAIRRFAEAETAEPMGEEGPDTEGQEEAGFRQGFGE